VPKLASKPRDRHGGLFYGGGFHQLGVQALGLAAVGAFTFTRRSRPAAVQGHVRDPHRAGGRERASTCPSTACGAIPSSTSRFPGGYGSEPTVLPGKHFADREVIVTQGSNGDSMYVVQSGKVEVVHTTEAGVDQQLATLKPGEFFGEMAIFEDEVRSATVRAVGDSRVLEVDRKTVEKRIQDDPRLAVHMLKTMSSRIRKGTCGSTGCSVPDA
jgi:hypothetical protein